MSTPLPLLACRPVEWPTSGPLSRMEPTFVYPGSIVALCDECRQQVYVGPKLQEAQEATGAPVHCFSCVSELGPLSPIVYHMGNEYEPE